MAAHFSSKPLFPGNLCLTPRRRKAFTVGAAGGGQHLRQDIMTLPPIGLVGGPPALSLSRASMAPLVGRLVFGCQSPAYLQLAGVNNRIAMCITYLLWLHQPRRLSFLKSTSFPKKKTLLGRLPHQGVWTRADLLDRSQDVAGRNSADDVPNYFER